MCLSDRGCCLRGCLFDGGQFCGAVRCGAAGGRGGGATGGSRACGGRVCSCLVGRCLLRSAVAVGVSVQHVRTCGYLQSLPRTHAIDMPASTPILISPLIMAAVQMRAGEIYIAPIHCGYSTQGSPVI